jgi:hypothetical protein
MQEKIVSELKKIASEIIATDNLSSVSELQESAKMLYEKLTVLRYVAASLETVPASQATPQQNVAPSEDEVIQKAPSTEVASPTFEPAKTAEMPVSETTVPEPDISERLTQEQPPLTIADEMQGTPEVFGDIFEALTPVATTANDATDMLVSEQNSAPSFVDDAVQEAAPTAPKETSLNDRLNTTIAIGLNDKIGFINHLFDGSSEDFNRVISQLNTLSSEMEAKHFISTMVKPDYNHWQGKEAYEERLISLIENKFS